MSATDADEEPITGGFATVDEKGRISLPKQVRRELGVRAGSSVAYVLLDHTLLLIPQDEHLASVMHNASRTLAEAGLTTEAILAALPEARAETLRETYGSEFMAELERLWQKYHANEHQQQGQPEDEPTAQKLGA